MDHRPVRTRRIRTDRIFSFRFQQLRRAGLAQARKLQWSAGAM